MRLLCLQIALGVALLAAGLPAAAQTAASSPAPAASAAPAAPAANAAAIELGRSRIDAMLRTGHADPSWFAASFLAQVSAAQVDGVIAQMIQALGAYQSVEFGTDKFVARFAKGTDDVLIHFDADGKIDGLLFRPPAISTSSLEDGLRMLQQTPGSVSYVIVQEGRSERAALNPSLPLAVGSAFKLAVLDALLDQIDGGARRWNDVVPLSAKWKTLPSGVLRTWPADTPLTLATYAAEMISISDNMAADALVRTVGQPALRKYAMGNEPFLTTREMFVLKSSEGAALSREYLAATTPAARTAVIARADAMPLPKVDQLDSQPITQIEWHYSVRQLCTLMRRVASLPLMSINPGVADAGSFAHVAYKGGSDTGILNLTTTVTTHRGTTLCFSATVNNDESEVNETAFEADYSAVLRVLAAL